MRATHMTAGFRTVRLNPGAFGAVCDQIAAAHWAVAIEGGVPSDDPPLAPALPEDSVLRLTDTSGQALGRNAGDRVAPSPWAVPRLCDGFGTPVLVARSAWRVDRRGL